VWIQLRPVAGPPRPLGTDENRPRVQEEVEDHASDGGRALPSAVPDGLVLALVVGWPRTQRSFAEMMVERFVGEGPASSGRPAVSRRSDIARVCGPNAEVQNHATGGKRQCRGGGKRYHFEPRPRLSGAVARLVAFWSASVGGLAKAGTGSSWLLSWVEDAAGPRVPTQREAAPRPHRRRRPPAARANHEPTVRPRAPGPRC